MKTTIPEGARAPTVLEATISLVALIVGITTSILIYGLDAHIPMVLGVVVASLMGLRCGFSWTNIQNGMVRGITNAIPAVIILLVVGMLIGIWIMERREKQAQQESDAAESSETEPPSGTEVSA